MANVLLLFEKAFRLVTPPWLQRTVGKALMESLGIPFDNEVTRTTQGVLIRYPDATQLEALGYIEQERRIIRGPYEPASEYVVRLAAWWDLHKTRGGAYALLGQMYPYFKDFLNVPMEVVNYAGGRQLLDTSGSITRDSIIWSGDGLYPEEWSRIWIMINLADPILPVTLITEGGDDVTTEGGDSVLLDVSASGLSAEEQNILCRVPREWSAAHLDQVNLVLLYPGAELWGYRITTDPPSSSSIGTWADTDPSPGQVWQATDPLRISCI